MSIFKTYDIRGIFGPDIDLDLSYRIGRGFARQMQAPTYMVGRDSRAHSADMYRAVIRGLQDEGGKVYGIGLSSTPQLHYLQIHDGAAAGVMVTASHNPPEYHGFKLFDGSGGSVARGTGLENVEETVRSLSPRLRSSEHGEPLMVEHALGRYVAFLCRAARGAKPTREIVIDACNGSSGEVLTRLAAELPLSALILNASPDGTFPNHDPNPLEERSTRQVSQKVRETGADLGAVLDGDGDRVVFVDETGQPILGCFSSALMAEELLEQDPGGAVVYDHVSSRALPEWIREKGGRAVVSRVGYTFLYDCMVREQAIFGSETSGHAYFRVTDSYYTESAAYAIIMMLRLLDRRGAELSSMIAPLKSRYAQARETNLAVEHEDRAFRRVELRYAEHITERLDGVSVSLPDYWFNLRRSNTEPVLRLRLEAIDEAVAATRLQELVKIIEGEAACEDQV